MAADRLGRSLKHLIETVTSLHKRNIGFRSLTENIDATTPTGKLIFHVFGAIADWLTPVPCIWVFVVVKVVGKQAAFPFPLPCNYSGQAVCVECGFIQHVLSILFT